MGVKSRREAERRRHQRIQTILISLVVAAVGITAVTLWLANRDTPAGPGPVAGPSPSITAGDDGPLSFLVNSAKCGFDNVISADDRIAAEGQFCEIAITVENSLDEAAKIPLECQYLIGTSNERYPAHEKATRVAAGDGAFDDGVPAGGSSDIAFQFDIPDAEGAKGAEFHSACDTDGIRLGLPAAES
jgi:hypothetical protein